MVENIILRFINISIYLLLYIDIFIFNLLIRTNGIINGIEQTIDTYNNLGKNINNDIDLLYPKIDNLIDKN